MQTKTGCLGNRGSCNAHMNVRTISLIAKPLQCSVACRTNFVLLLYYERLMLQTRPWTSVGVTIPGFGQPSDQVVTTLSQPCDNLVPTLPPPCSQVVTRLLQAGCTTLWQGCHNLVFSIWEASAVFCCLQYEFFATFVLWAANAADKAMNLCAGCRGAWNASEWSLPCKYVSLDISFINGKPFTIMYFHRLSVHRLEYISLAACKVSTQHSNT